jgi:hypothetical protein
MTAVIPLAGGKVCFDAIDCVAGQLHRIGDRRQDAIQQTGGGLRQGQAISASSA